MAHLAARNRRLMGGTSRPCEPVGTDWPAVTDPTPAPPTNP